MEEDDDDDDEDFVEASSDLEESGDEEQAEKVPIKDGVDAEETSRVDDEIKKDDSDCNINDKKKPVALMGDTTLVGAMWSHYDQQADMTAFADTTLCKILTSADDDHKDASGSSFDTKIAETSAESWRKPGEGTIEKGSQENTTTRSAETTGGSWQKPGEGTIEKEETRHSKMWQRLDGDPGDETLCRALDSMEAAIHLSVLGEEDDVDNVTEDISVDITRDITKLDQKDEIEELARLTRDSFEVEKAFQEENIVHDSWRRPVGDRTMWRNVWSVVNKEGEVTLRDRIDAAMEKKADNTIGQIWENVNAEGDTTIMGRIEAVLAQLPQEYREGRTSPLSQVLSSPLPEMLSELQVPTNSTLRASTCLRELVLSDISSIGSQEGAVEVNLANRTPDMFSPNFTLFNTVQKKAQFNKICWTTLDDSGLEKPVIIKRDPEERVDKDASFAVHVQPGDLDTFLELAEQKHSELYNIEEDGDRTRRGFNRTIFDPEDDDATEQEKQTKAKWYFRSRSSRVGGGLGSALKRPDFGLGHIFSPEMTPRRLVPERADDTTLMEHSFNRFIPRDDSDIVSFPLLKPTKLTFVDDEEVAMMGDIWDQPACKDLRTPLYVDTSLPAGWLREVR